MGRDIMVLGKSVDPSSLPLLGEGGEARVYDLSRIMPGKILKVFRRPSEIQGAEMQKLARERLEELRSKLKNFPELPSGVAGPEGVIEDATRVVAVIAPKIDGYTLKHLASYDWRKQNAMSLSKVQTTYVKLGMIIAELHKRGIVIGDFKPDNVIVSPTGPVIIDTESFQFGKFAGRGYSEGYVDPKICELRKGQLTVTTGKFTPASDWFAFGVAVFEALTFVSPYGGIKIPAKGKPPLTPEERVMKGVSVLSKNVIAPPVAKLDVLSPPLRRYFAGLFMHKHRDPFPFELIGGPSRRRLPRGKFKAVAGGFTSCSQL